MQYGGDDLCDGNCHRLARSPQTVIDDVSVGSEDSPLIVEEGITFETSGETDEDHYSSFETIGWEIVEYKKNKSVLCSSLYPHEAKHLGTRNFEDLPSVVKMLKASNPIN